MKSPDCSSCGACFTRMMRSWNSSWRWSALLRWFFCLVACLAAIPLANAQNLKLSPEQIELAKKATTDKVADFHVIIREAIKSSQQKDWTAVYNGTVELHVKGKPVVSFRCSTLPNDKPPAADPKKEYSLTLSTGTMKVPLKGERYYTWKRGLREDGIRPCLRLASEVPTVNVGTERDREKFISFLINGAEKGDFHFATNILVHAGFKDAWRGSAGCLTIHPDDAKKFFDAIPVDTVGTLSLFRGIEDEKTKTSHDY